MSDENKKNKRQDQNNEHNKTIDNKKIETVSDQQNTDIKICKDTNQNDDTNKKDFISELIDKSLFDEKWFREELWSLAKESNNVNEGNESLKFTIGGDSDGGGGDSSSGGDAGDSGGGSKACGGDSGGDSGGF